MLFISKYKEHKVILIPARYLIDNYGRRIFQQGKYAQFHDFSFETQDPEIIKLLQENPYYNVDFKGVEDKKPMSEQAKIITQQEMESAENTLTSCPFCPFKAQTAFGLRSHIRTKHKDETG